MLVSELETIMKTLVESLQYNVVMLVKDKLSVEGKNVFSRNSELCNDYRIKDTVLYDVVF